MPAEWIERRRSKPSKSPKPKLPSEKERKKQLEQQHLLEHIENNRRFIERQQAQFKADIDRNRDIIQSCREHLGLLNGKGLVNDVREALRTWRGEWGEVHDFVLPNGENERGGMYVVGIFRNAQVRVKVGDTWVFDKSGRENSQVLPNNNRTYSEAVYGKRPGYEGIGIVTYAGPSWICYSEPFFISSTGENLSTIRELSAGKYFGHLPFNKLKKDPAKNHELDYKVGNLDIQRREIMDGLARSVNQRRR